MTYADTTRRQAFIAGLRALADFLESNPGVPVPDHTTDVLVFPPSGSYDEKKREIDIIASRIGSGTENSRGGHYMASRRFGPVEYCAVAIPADQTRSNER
ncbi:MAG: hypothetical protein JO345_17360 [Streptosporangiaceae bacterium]|nr:hypothetical protein [Streptosporangiaceae bacterium]